MDNHWKDQTFQSTLPRGERQFQSRSLASCPIFQSTLPRGERLFTSFYHFNHVVFQSTLPRGERPVTLHHIKGDILFQSTLPRGERHYTILHDCYNFTISIHAPARGATWCRQILRHCIYFNPRSREGSDMPCF